MTETYDLAPGHTITVVIRHGTARYTCTCRKLVNGDVDAAHFHSDLVTP